MSAFPVKLNRVDLLCFLVQNSCRCLGNDQSKIERRLGIDDLEEKSKASLTNEKKGWYTWWLGYTSISASTTFSRLPAANTTISAISSGVKGSQPLQVRLALSATECLKLTHILHQLLPCRRKIVQPRIPVDVSGF